MSFNRKIINTYYVSTTGNDAHDGLSPETAWQTVGKVNSTTILPGETVLFEGGKEFTGQLTKIITATSKQPVTFGSYGEGKATIVGNASGGIRFTNSSGIVLKDLKVKGINQGASGVHGIFFPVDVAAAGHSVDILISNVEVFGFVRGRGIMCYSSNATFGIRNMVVEYCDSHHNRDGIVLQGNYEVNPIRVSGNNIIRHSRAWDNAGDSLFGLGPTGFGISLGQHFDSTIEYCEAFNNGRSNGIVAKGPTGISLTESLNCTIQYSESHHNKTPPGNTFRDGNGFLIDGGSNTCTVQYSYSHDNDGGGYVMFEYGVPFGFDGNKVRYCISVNDGMRELENSAVFIGGVVAITNNAFHNNLVYIDSKHRRNTTKPISAVRFQGAGHTNLNIFNNIWIIDGGFTRMLNPISAVQGSWANNIFFSLGGGDLNYFSGGVIIDPLIKFIPDPAPTIGIYPSGILAGTLEGFKLLAQSPAINAGAAVIALPLFDFWGNPVPNGTVNIGPHEYF
jgi:hypothetical protein